MDKEKLELRSKIDKIDDQVLKLLNRRAGLARQIIKFKKATYDPVRERAILERLSAANTGPMPNRSLQMIYREILSACRQLQQPITVSFLGPQGSFSHAAAIRHFGNNITEAPASDINNVFDEVEKESAEFGVVPVENSSEGVITVTLDRLAESPLRICGELQTEIALCLLSKAASIDKIKKLYTHPKPLEQSSDWVRRQLAKWEIVQAASSADAARLAAKTANSGAIASRIAAKIYSLKVIEERIENTRNNVTRFLVIGKLTTPPTGRDKTSTVFSVRHEPGALYRALNAFEKHQVNLTMIHSRPSRKESWEYLFFVDMQGHESDAHIKAAFNEIRPQITYMKVLGSYPEPIKTPLEK